MTPQDVLLLGGTGFIGSALAASLQTQGRAIHVFGRNQWSQLEQVLPQCGTVIHLASCTTPGSSALNPELELVNINLTLRLLVLLQTQPKIHLIFFSSGGTAYGNPDRLSVTEDAPLAPLSNHGAGKVSQEAFCTTLRSRGHAVTILRPSNAYGPGQAIKSGFGLVRTMLEHARVGSTLEVWGDGEIVRDFIYIDDIVAATLRLISMPQDADTYNVGSGTGHSINQVRDIVEAVCGKQLRTVFRPGRGADVRSVVLDNTRLAARAGWQPNVGLAEGVARTWKWLQRE